MRNGDSYKIVSMLKHGVSDSDICKRFRNEYPEDEIKKFIKGAKESAKAKAKEREPKPAAKAASEATAGRRARATQTPE